MTVPALLIISEKSNHEVSAITQFMPAQSWFHLVLDVIHSRYRIFMDVSKGIFSIHDLETNCIIESSGIKSVWLPRLDFMYEEGFTKKDKFAKYFASEYFSLIDGMIACVEHGDCLIVTHPNATYSAGNKVRQQQVAANLGMRLPPQIIANRKEFLFDQWWWANSIFKPIHSSNLHYDKQTNEHFMGKPVILTAKLLAAIQKNRMDITVHYFQERLIPVSEYRIVVFGEQVFPFKISGNYEIDWRGYLDKIDITFQKEFIYTKQCIAYNKHFGLTLGCFDFIETTDGIFFIECNPPGYIQFCDPDNKAGMLEAFAHYLLH